MTETELIKALVEKGELQQLSIEIENGFDINTKLYDEANILHYASQLGQNEIISFIIDKGIDVNSQSGQYVTPLHMAVDNAHLSTVQLLIEKGADLYRHDENGYQAIHTACFTNGTPEILQYLIDKGSDVNARINRDSVALNIAIESNKIELVEILLTNGANVNNIDETKFTPLFYAIKRNRGEILRLLIKNGADIYHIVPKNISALYYCAKAGQENCIKPLIEAGYNYREEINGESPFHSAAIEGYGYILQMAAESGVDLNFKDSKGKTMLEYAFENENKFAVKSLLRAGVNLSEEQLQSAAQNGDFDSLVKLVETAPNTIFSNKMTLVHMVVKNEEPELLEKLLKLTTDNLNLQDNEGNTALHYATYAYNQELFPQLIKAGADPTIINNSGNNIINRMHPDISSENILLLKGYPELFTRKSQYNETPLELVLSNSFPKAIPAFAQIYFEMNDTAVYSRGFTPIQMAAALGVKEALDKLVKDKQLSKTNEDGNNILWFLLPYEDYDKENSRIKRVVDAGIDINNRNNQGITTLMQASIKGDSWAREALLKGGADTSIPDNFGITPLHFVTSKGWESAIKELLAYGANPDIKDKKGVTARDLADADDAIKELFSHY